MSIAFSYDLEWETPAASGSAADATWGTLTIRVGDFVLWSDGTGGTASVRWTWIDLLECLAERWPWIRAEEGWPRGLHVETPLDFASASRRALEACTERERKGLAQRLYDFRWRHDLSRGLHGIALPELWLVREGKSIWIGSRIFSARLGFDEALATTEALGQAIADRILTSADQRARDALALWENRNKANVGEVIEIATGLTKRELQDIANGDLETTFEMQPGTLEPTELVAVARMASSVAEPSALRAILRHMRSAPARSTPVIDKLSDEALAASTQWKADRGYTEGYQLARWLRERLSYQDTMAIDPLLLLRGWGVSVRKVDLHSPEIDAVACWGPQHGPAVLLNTNLAYSTEARTRATLAHEIAHLIFDRRDALPLSEVMGGQAPEGAERRARAFAAELLLPRAVAGEEFATTTDLKAAMTRLCRRYKVSKEVTAWQGLNSGNTLSKEAEKFLRKHVHNR